MEQFPESGPPIEIGVDQAELGPVVSYYGLSPEGRALLDAMLEAYDASAEEERALRDRPTAADRYGYRRTSRVHFCHPEPDRGWFED